jgi:hypothetical protein
MTTNAKNEDVVAQASEGRTGIAQDVLGFLSETKKWWLAPIVICFLLFGLLIFLSSTAAAPFIYTLF